MGVAMETVVERLARKNGAKTPDRELTVLPVVHKEHDGACGGSCGCGDEGRCCG